ncbi:hypothetical protein FRC12_014464 [Ceratobasidium sp. 428]|nr:hypothetical protein FRC12_014464 [Ceratobasidium sp. 428]
MASLSDSVVAAPVAPGRCIVSLSAMLAIKVRRSGIKTLDHMARSDWLGLRWGNEPSLRDHTLAPRDPERQATNALDMLFVDCLRLGTGTRECPIPLEWGPGSGDQPFVVRSDSESGTESPPVAGQQQQTQQTAAAEVEPTPAPPASGADPSQGERNNHGAAETIDLLSSMTDAATLLPSLFPSTNRRPQSFSTRGTTWWQQRSLQRRRQLASPTALCRRRPVVRRKQLPTTLRSDRDVRRDEESPLATEEKLGGGRAIEDRTTLRSSRRHAHSPFLPRTFQRGLHSQGSFTAWQRPSPPSPVMYSPPK